MSVKTIAGIFLILGYVAMGATLPDTAAGKVAAEYLDAFNRQDYGRLEALYARLQMKVPPQAAQQLRVMTGGFDLVRVEKQEANALSMLVAERNSDTIAVLDVTLEESGKGMIKGGPVPRPKDLAIARMAEGEVLKALEAKASQQAKDDLFSGTVLIAKGGKVLFEKAYGMADREKKIANTLDTKFRIGSMNKMFTSVAMLQLVEAGKVSLDDPLIKFVPDYPNKEFAEKVKIRHLLSHTGGTGEIFTPEYDKQRLNLKEHADYVKLYGSRGLEFEPGSKWSYSNYGMLLAGYVIEKVSGKSYYDYVRENIFRKAGMKDTDSLPETEAVAKRAVAYTSGSGKWAAADDLPYRGTAAGGGYSTAGDLLRFATALQEGKLLKKELFEQAITPVMNRYGFGFQRRKEAWGHGGGAPGMNGTLLVDPKSGYVYIALSNFDPPSAQRLADFAYNRMPE